VIQPVATQQKNIAGKDLLLAAIEINEQVVSQRPAKNVAQGGISGFLRRKQPETGLVLYDRMVPRERCGVVSADQITPGIAGMSHHDPIKAQSTRDDGC